MDQIPTVVIGLLLVIIVVLRSTSNEHRFKDFLLILEHDESKVSIGDITSNSVGTFQLKNILTKFSDKCPNSVTNTNVIPKSEVEISWRAPDAGSACVVFRAVLAESRDVWYNQGDSLTKVFCEDEQRSEDSLSNVLNHCTACDEAKYEVTFEGLWSRNTHPKDFPSDKWRTRFSDVIGASHTIDYSFWNYADVASEGLRELAENASTRALESELKAQSDNIRTIIKARGISYPNVTGKTFAVFRVDNRHHLMSLVSMIFPSPDWFVGVTSLELCLPDGSWVESAALRLYPIDAGTDDGITYDAPNQPTLPRGVISKMTSDNPNDENSPFYDKQGIPIKPLAKLYLSRQRLYEKTCNSVEENGNNDCETTEWSEWTPCSVTCGSGVKYKQRRYNNDGPHHNCHESLTLRASCKGQQQVCREEQDSSVENDPRCQLTEWSQFSSCSVSCGIGVKTRNRRYKNRSAAKRCAAGRENPPILEQNLVCMGEADNCDSTLSTTTEENDDCPNSPWSDFSPCSVTCGKGIKERHRLSLEEGDQQPLLMRQSTRQINTYYDEEIIEEDEDVTETDPCAVRVQRVECISEDAPTCDDVTYPAAITCSLPRDVGLCQSNVDRWYFDTINGKCEIFSYSGCHGNHNNFKSLEICQEICGQYQRELLANRTAQKRQLGVTVSGVLSYNMHIQNDAANNCDISSTTTELDNDVTAGPDAVNCAVSPWSTWGRCNVSGDCGRGIKEKHRYIITHPLNGGEPCPELTRRKDCKIKCRKHKPVSKGRPTLETQCEMSEWSAWSPCSQSCGPEAVQQRTRKILRRVSEDGEPCSFRIEQKSCNLLACPLR